MPSPRQAVAGQPAEDRKELGPTVSVVLPTYNEAESLRDAVARVQEALRETPNHEIVVVDDDSPDGTWRIAEELHRHDRRIRCLRRVGERGLASAIFAGLAAAGGRALVVIDADLQHDPKAIPRLVGSLETADLVVASRYAPGGSTSSWSSVRRWSSRLATRLGQWALGLEVSDPMSGFFAIRSARFRDLEDRLRPRGFKALLEILSRARDLRVAEVPYTFGPRRAGASKLGAAVLFDYLLSLVELRTGRVVSARFVRYCLVGLSGVFVQLLGVAVLSTVLAETVALPLAILAAMTSNFTLNNAWTFRDMRLSSWAFGGGLIRFVVVSAVGAVLNDLVSLGVHRAAGIDLVWASLAGIAVAAVWNYQLNRRVTWKSGTMGSKGVVP